MRPFTIISFFSHMASLIFKHLSMLQVRKAKQQSGLVISHLLSMWPEWWWDSGQRDYAGELWPLRALSAHACGPLPGLEDLYLEKKCKIKKWEKKREKNEASFYHYGEKKQVWNVYLGLFCTFSGLTERRMNSEFVTLGRIRWKINGHYDKLFQLVSFPTCVLC